MHVYVHVTVHGWVGDVRKSEGSYFLVFVQNQNFSLTLVSKVLCLRCVSSVVVFVFGSERACVMSGIP